MLGFSPHVCATHCEGQCYGKDADRVRHLARCAAQSLVRVVQVNVVTILALQLPLAVSGHLSVTRRACVPACANADMCKGGVRKRLLQKADVCIMHHCGDVEPSREFVAHTVCFTV
jgi:hypothetical protein